MKKLILAIGIILCGCTQNTNFCDTLECKRHIQHYERNYIAKNTISFGKNSDNENCSAPYTLEERRYDADDFRAGARHVCGTILKRSGKDVCREVGYTAVY